MTVSSINRLGRRIRHSELVSPDDLEALQRLLAEYFETLVECQERVGSALPRVVVTPRLKTVGTIVDKLKRERTMSLSKMRDIAGIRIVEDMTRVEQDVLVRDLVSAFDRALVIDRRREPRYGYRAVHLEVLQSGRFVEIQVRTKRQDQWAQIVERLGDRWGRQIRYGGEPNEPDAELTPGWPRRRLWGLVVGVGNSTDQVEAAIADAQGRDLTDVEQEQLDVLRGDIDELLRDLADVLSPDAPDTVEP